MNNPFFPRGNLRKMTELGLSEATVRDVFYNGEHLIINGTEGRSKKYSGEAVGLLYQKSNSTGDYPIVAVWRKKRR